jgi:hypothetical protein
MERLNVEYHHTGYIECYSLKKLGNRGEFLVKVFKR